VVSAVAVPLVGLVVVLAGHPSRGVVAAVLAITAGSALVGVRPGPRRYIAELEQSRGDARRALVRLGDALGAADDREALVGVVLEAARAIAGADSSVFWFDRGPEIVARARHGEGTDADRRVAPGEGLVGAVARSGDPAVWPGGTAPPAPGEPRGAAALAVPVRARGRLYGILSLHRERGAPFTTDQVDDVLLLVRQAGAAIDSSYMHEDARRMSLTDGLTGLWNRRQFELRATQELERGASFGESFAVVILDLDDFKLVNDTYGHPTGDAVLVETANRLVAHTRDVDLVARYGGEEFVLLLPQTDGTGAARVAEKVRKELAGAPVETDAASLSITLSAGVACHPEDGATVQSVLAAADSALYRAKAAGKNQVVSADVHESGAASA
jgi:diguanylate cyclase (GGDEF)-like protein